MTTFKRFEDMHAWQSARELAQLIYSATHLPDFKGDPGLCDQIRRAVISVMSNIAEGFGTGTDAEFIRFLSYARRSVSETQSQLYAALDQNYVSAEQFETAYTKANETERQINALIGYLSHSRNQRGSTREETAEYSIETHADLQDLLHL